MIGHMSERNVYAVFCHQYSTDAIPTGQTRDARGTRPVPALLRHQKSIDKTKLGSYAGWACRTARHRSARLNMRIRSPRAWPWEADWLLAIIYYISVTWEQWSQGALKLFHGYNFSCVQAFIINPNYCCLSVLIIGNEFGI